MHEYDPPPGVSLTHVEVGFWNLVAFHVKNIAAFLLALLPFLIVAILAIGAYVLISAG